MMNHGNLMVYEQNHINKYHKDENKKSIAFNAKTINEEKLDEANSEGMNLLTHCVKKMLKQRKKATSTRIINKGVQQ